MPFRFLIYIELELHLSWQSCRVWHSYSNVLKIPKESAKVSLKLHLSHFYILTKGQIHMSEVKRVSNSDESTENYLNSVSLSSMESFSIFQLTVLVRSLSVKHGGTFSCQSSWCRSNRSNKSKRANIGLTFLSSPETYL